MAWLSVSDLATRLKRGGPAPVYVLAGAESFLQREAVTALKEHLFGSAEGGSLPPGSVTVLDGADVTVGDVLEEVTTRSFFAQAKLVLVENAGGFLKAHAVGAEFMEKVGPPTSAAGAREAGAAPPIRGGARSAVLVLMVATLDRRTAFAKAAEKMGAVVDCGSLSTRGPTRELRTWVRERAAHHGLSLAFGTEDALIERAGVALASLDQELLKLSLYLADRSPKAPLQPADVEGLIDRSRTILIYELTDAVVQGDGPKALRLAQELCRQGLGPGAILGVLGAQFRRLWLIKHRLAEGASVSEACQEADIRQQFLWERAADAARSRTAEALASALQDIAQADRILKGHAGIDLAEDVLVETLVIRLCRAGASAARAVG
jgi:DNA polymerase-3 subunit delta